MCACMHIRMHIRMHALLAATGRSLLRPPEQEGNTVDATAIVQTYRALADNKVQEEDGSKDEL